MIFIDRGWHTDEIVADYFYRKTNSLPSKVDKSFLYDKKRVYLLVPMPVTDMLENYYQDFLVLQKMLLDDGFVEVSRTEFSTFINYILYEKQ